MKAPRILGIIAYLLIIIGLGSLVYGGLLASSTDSISMTIPAGSGYYVSARTESTMWMNAHLEGKIEVPSGSVDAFVLTSDQFAQYQYDLLPGTSLWEYHGSLGEFSVDLPGVGRYYVVVDHGSDSESIAQTVTLTYTLSGINLLDVIIGAVMIAVGATLAFVSIRMRKKDTGPQPALATSSSSDVRMFDGKEKLQ